MKELAATSPTSDSQTTSRNHVWSAPVQAIKGSANAARDAGPFATIQASGEVSYRPGEQDKWRNRLNAATSINLVDNDSWQAKVSGSLGYLLPEKSAAGGLDYGAQASLYHKSDMGTGKEPAKTGVDLGFTYRSQDPFDMASPELFSLKTTFTLRDLVKLSIVYNQITGEKLDPALPKNDFLFMIAPGPGIISF